MPSKLTLATAGAALALALLPSTAQATDVCNEAENSHRGGYTVNGGPVDPNPPAFLRGSQMRVGKGNAGLVHAAERSPALRTCGPTTPGGGNGGGGGGGGGEEPIIDV